MDRILVWPGQIPQDTDLLGFGRYALVGMGSLFTSFLGSNTRVDGLACTPGTGLHVIIGPGAIYATDYGSMPADAVNQIVKQGLTWGDKSIGELTAPVTAGQSVVWLIEAQFQEIDGAPVNLPYYNSANPTQPLWASTNTVRAGVCVLQAKQGSSATTGSQVAPSPDSGWTPLYAVTVAHGDTTISSGKIIIATDAPFIPNKLGQLENVKTINTNQDVTLANSGMAYNATGAVTINLPQARTIPNGWWISVSAQGGSVTLAPQTGNSFCGGGLGASYVLPQGSSVRIVRDDTGTNWITLFSTIANNVMSGEQALYYLGYVQ
jgi:hypothetical protein